MSPAEEPEKEEENADTGVSKSGHPGALGMMETGCTSVQIGSRMPWQQNTQDLDGKMPSLAPSGF